MARLPGALNVGPGSSGLLPKGSGAPWEGFKLETHMISISLKCMIDI